MVAVIECVLNQNARDRGAARFTAMNSELVRLCQLHDVAMLQMPCPEIAALGWKRARQPGQSIRAALDTDAGRRRCAEIAAEVAGRIGAQVAGGGVLLAILGGNRHSPGCAVHDSERGLLAESGVFMKELQAALRARGLDVPFRGMRDDDPALHALDLAWLRALFERQRPISAALSTGRDRR